jgi:glycosyltransferase involved in cell wall biosynthesis
VKEHVSLIIPCAFQHVPQLATAIASVELSEVVPSQKIIVIDGFDLTRDVSGKLRLLGYEVIRNTRTKGVSGAKNTGLDALNSDCEYIVFLDADDIMHPKRIGASIAELQNRHLLIWGTQAIGFKTSEISLYKSAIYGHPRRPIKLDKIQKRSRKGKVVMVYASMVMKKETQKLIGLFDETLLRGEDYDFIDRALKLSCKIENSPDLLYAYRHPRFDNYARFKVDNEVRGVRNTIPLRYLINIFYRLFNLRLNKKVRKEWRFIFSQTESIVENHGLFKSMLEI